MVYSIGGQEVVACFDDAGEEGEFHGVLGQAYQIVGGGIEARDGLGMVGVIVIGQAVRVVIVCLEEM